MDKELLDFLQAFREETTKRFDGIGQEFQNVRQEFGQEFQKVRQEFGQEFQNVSQELRSLREGTEQRFEKLETDVRGAYIVFEGLRGEVQLVAEGVTGVTQQLRRQGEEYSRRLDTIESFIRLCYQDLDVRVRRLEAT